MPHHLESMRDEVERHAKASFFSLHNLAADRWRPSVTVGAQVCTPLCSSILLCFLQRPSWFLLMHVACLEIMQVGGLCSREHQGNSVVHFMVLHVTSACGQSSKIGRTGSLASLEVFSPTVGSGRHDSPGGQAQRLTLSQLPSVA